MSEQPSATIQLNDEEIAILENDYDRWRIALLFVLIIDSFPHRLSYFCMFLIDAQT